MPCKSCYGLNVLSTISILIINMLVVWYTFWSANRKIEKKHLAVDKARSIVRQLDAIDDVVFSYCPVYNFIKIKINAAVDAMDDENDDLAVEYFTDALLLIGPNRKVSRLMQCNLPRDVITKIKKSYGKYLEGTEDVET